MKSTRLKTRIAGTAAAVAVLGGASLAMAPGAAAKATLISIERAQLRGDVLSVTVKYSCDPGDSWQLVSKMTKVDQEEDAKSLATATVPADKITCDYQDRILKLKLKPTPGSHFVKGDEVKVTANYAKPGEQNDDHPLALITTVL
ncbi:hypothetical protein CP973_05400 [Streptomyces albofaciens JCM 4342]|uniref:hypothetical protein n=1 Tax=Streptomyces albofaciens TaxID=66866 RepID=UPI0012399109|nr:hypothetical protein [Streptomyces albofaciens]KAA6221482.1 hypothetical protein CP973_05400 [Streptomyces albofaciens JCM 4342]